ncbi:MAG TPA: hypothetical protein VGG61_02875 [Gemmataceae bacterium]|jgi:hypothetical protein
MMTRETKIGLGVACSFLCLLGVVLAGKYTTLFGTPPSSDADTFVASNDTSEIPKKDTKAPDKRKKDPPSSTEALPTLEPVPNAPTVVQAGGTNLDDLPPLPPSRNTKPTEDAPVLPEPTKAGKTDEKNTDDLPPLPETEGTKVVTSPVPPTPPDGESSGDTESKAPIKKGKPAPDTETTTDAKNVGDDATKLPPLTDKEPAKKPERAAEISIDLPPPPPLKKNPPESPTAATSGTKVVPAMPLPVDNPPPKATASSPNGEKGGIDTGLPDNSHVALGKPVQGNQGDSPRPPPHTKEPLRAGNTTEATPTSRVPTRPATGANPRVESFDEETYRPRQDDTFASISKRYYQTDKYAQALLLFNREHPRAAEGVRRDPPDLTGQAVYIPPIHVLEKRHGHAIDGYTPPPSNPIPVGRETPLRESPSASRPEAANSATYQVSPNGETMMEIARMKLGNGERWREIDKLNPGWRPDYPIPGGTTLRLPAESR